MVQVAKPVKLTPAPAATFSPIPTTQTTTPVPAKPVEADRGTCDPGLIPKFKGVAGKGSWVCADSK